MILKGMITLFMAGSLLAAAGCTATRQSGQGARVIIENSTVRNIISPRHRAG
jgi:hypothetical protein